MNWKAIKNKHYGKILWDEFIKYSVLLSILFTVPYAAYILSLELSTFFTLLLLALNPITIRTTILLYVKREVLINSYYLFEGYFLARKAEKDERNNKDNS